MKLEIFDKPEPKPEEPVRLQLAPHDDGIILRAVHSDGTPIGGGNILCISGNGTIRLALSCRVPGFQTDDEGRVIVVK